MVGRVVAMVGLLLWAVPALAEAPGFCPKTEEARAAGLAAIEMNCAAANVDALSCYNAGRVFQRSIANLQKLHSDELGRCAGFDRATLDNDLARARKVTTLMAREAYATMHAQLAEDHASHLAMSTLRAYACTYLVNSFARDNQLAMDSVRVEAAGDAPSGKPWRDVIASITVQAGADSPGFAEVRFGSDRFHDVCGRVTFSDTGDFRSMKTFGDAYLAAAEKLSSLGFEIADTFLPRGKPRDPEIGKELDAVIAEFRRQTGDAVRNAADHEKTGAVRKEPITAKGPDTEILERSYPGVWAVYTELIKWLEGTVVQ